MLTLILMFHLNFILQQQNMQPINRSSQSLIQLTNPNINNNHQRIPNAVGIMHSNNMGGPRGPRPLDQVTCYKVGTQFDFMHNFFFHPYFDAHKMHDYIECLFAFFSAVRRAITQTNAQKDTWRFWVDSSFLNKGSPIYVVITCKLKCLIPGTLPFHCRVIDEWWKCGSTSLSMCQEHHSQYTLKR